MHGYLDEERAYRDAMASRYDGFFGDYQMACERQAILRSIGREPGFVLDVGCGTERFGVLLGERASQLVGVDFSHESLRVALGKGLAGTSFVEGSVLSLPIASAVVDTVVSIQVLEHLIEPEDARRMLEEIRRVLKPGGSALITVYHYHVLDRLLRRKSGRTPDHRFVQYTRAEARRLVAEIFGDWATMRDEPLCLFLRAGTRWLQRLRPFERHLGKVPGMGLLGSFVALRLRTAR